MDENKYNDLQLKIKNIINEFTSFINPFFDIVKSVNNLNEKFILYDDYNDPDYKINVYINSNYEYSIKKTKNSLIIKSNEILDYFNLSDDEILKFIVKFKDGVLFEEHLLINDNQIYYKKYIELNFDRDIYEIEVSYHDCKYKYFYDPLKERYNIKIFKDDKLIIKDYLKNTYLFKYQEEKNLITYKNDKIISVKNCINYKSIICKLSETIIKEITISINNKIIYYFVIDDLYKIGIETYRDSKNKKIKKIIIYDDYFLSRIKKYFKIKIGLDKNIYSIKEVIYEKCSKILIIKYKYDFVKYTYKDIKKFIENDEIDYIDYSSKETNDIKTSTTIFISYDQNNELLEYIKKNNERYKYVKKNNPEIVYIFRNNKYRFDISLKIINDKAEDIILNREDYYIKT